MLGPPVRPGFRGGRLTYPLTSTMFSPPKAVLPTAEERGGSEISAASCGKEPLRMNVVIVESVAKAKAINKYLGSNFKVLASYGHVRDLPPKDGSVRPDDDFDMSWQVDPRSEKHISEIAKALKGARHLYLATDPDREGEAISWHVREILNSRKALEGIDVKRVV